MNKRFAKPLAVSFAWFGLSFPGAQGRGRLASVQNYTIYYGPPTEQAMGELQSKDLAVIEPTAYTREQIRALRESGTFAAGYISVMEAPGWNQFRLDRLQPDDFLRLNGDRVYFRQWDSYLMDLRRDSYKQSLLQEIQASIVDKGLQGVFLDTVGDIDDYVTDGRLQRELRLAYKELLRHIVRAYPKLLLIQNRGFGSLDQAVPYIHGVLWEDWKGDGVKEPWSQAVIDRLAQARKKGLQVFAVSGSSDAVHAKAAGTLKFVHLAAPGGYVWKVH